MTIIHDFEVSWDSGLSTLSFGLSQSHGHGSWLVCEVALNGFTKPIQIIKIIIHSFEYLKSLEDLHPAALKGRGKHFNAALEKNMPHPSP